MVKGALLLDIGCLECGCSSEVVGWFATVDEAKAGVDDHDEWQPAEDAYWGGQVMYAVVDLDLDQPKIVAAAFWRAR